MKRKLFTPLLPPPSLLSCVYSELFYPLDLKKSRYFFCVFDLYQNPWQGGNKFIILMWPVFVFYIYIYIYIYVCVCVCVCVWVCVLAYFLLLICSSKHWNITGCVNPVIVFQKRTMIKWLNFYMIFLCIHIFPLSSYFMKTSIVVLATLFNPSASSGEGLQKPKHFNIVFSL